MAKKELVLNWHITEACNYRCQYCYAKWDKAAQGRELIHDPVATMQLLQELWAFFRPDNVANPLRQELQWESVRLNFAGGEPLLYPARLQATIEAAHQLGFRTSLITNASGLTEARLLAMAPYLAVLGISLDSAQAERNAQIGRLDHKGQQLSLDRLVSSLVLCQQSFPKMQLKLNTVVNALNWDEDMNALIRRIAPQKWKILRMLPSITNNLAVSTAQFQAFVARHAHQTTQLCVEDNQEMAESYIMIDPHGRFFQNALGKQGYRYSEAIIHRGAASAFARTSVCATKFNARYQHQLPEQRAAA